MLHTGIITYSFTNTITRAMKERKGKRATGEQEADSTRVTLDVENKLFAIKSARMYVRTYMYVSTLLKS